jgi:hypothetical protein
MSALTPKADIQGSRPGNRSLRHCRSERLSNFDRLAVTMSVVLEAGLNGEADVSRVPEPQAVVDGLMKR